MASKAVDSHVTEPAIAEVSPDLPAQHLYRHGFFDPYMRRHWPKLVRTLILPVCLDAVLILGCLSMYWATLQQNNQLGRLTVAVVDLDRGLLGNQVVQGLKTLTSSPINTLQWIFEDSVASDAQSQAWVLDERYWAVLQGKVFLPSFLQLLRERKSGLIDPHLSVSKRNCIPERVSVEWYIILQPNGSTHALLCLRTSGNDRQFSCRAVCNGSTDSNPECCWGRIGSDVY